MGNVLDKLLERSALPLSDDNTELGLLLPHRGGLPFVEFLPRVFLTGCQELLMPDPDDLSAAEGQSAIFYTPESGDNGTRCHFLHWEGRKFLLEPTGPSLGACAQLRRPLLFLLARPRILGFFAGWKHSSQGAHYFELPTRVLARTVRRQRRVPIEGNILTRTQDRRMHYGKLHDFSPVGASVLLDVGWGLSGAWGDGLGGV